MRHDFSGYARSYRSELLDRVVPFWIQYALDPSGAINNCISDDGVVLSKDRYIWSQGRALWTFSALYNRVEQRAGWLEVAQRLFAYLCEHGRDSRGRWMFRLDESGHVLDRDNSIYVDGFVLNGMGEYFIAGGDRNAARIAAETCGNVRERIRTGDYSIAPYVLPTGMKPLGIPMVFSFFFYNCGLAIGDDAICSAGLDLADEILRDFYSPEHNAVMEMVAIDGPTPDSPKARVCIPGHVLEALWFLISIDERAGRFDRIPRCAELILRHLELGWDDQYGGLRLAVDVEGAQPDWQQPDCKPWWVQLEAMAATAYAYLHTGDQACLDWHERVREYAFGHYPTPAGEWINWLDRQGQPTTSAALPVKDPFHLPRALIYLIDVFTRLAESKE